MNLQIDGCAVSSIGCRVVVFLQQVPQLLAVPALTPIVQAPLDDLNLLLPGVSDQEYLRAQAASGHRLLAALAACQGPPSSAYVAVQDGQAGTVPVGQNSVGEVCRRLDLGGGATDVYCGDWEEPSARVRPGGPDTGVDLALLANGEAGGAGWRSNIDARFACAPDVRPTTILGAARAVVLECRYRNGGFPQVAMVAAVGGRSVRRHHRGGFRGDTAHHRRVGRRRHRHGR